MAFVHVGGTILLYTTNDRKRAQHADDNSDIGRSEFRRDYGRLLHCPAFRRLQGKTQLFPGHESDFFRNRLTHSLEVAQIAKGIALRLNHERSEFRKNSIDLDLIEFAGLAHDLGHPPFGHNGERALDDCMKQYGGFEGNAQTLHILVRVEKKVVRRESGTGDICGISPTGADLRLGLNLTYRTLASVLKYDEKIPLRRRKSSDLKKGYYGCDEEIVAAIKSNVGKPIDPGTSFKTIECKIMDIADDIAYCTYDLEDAMKGGFTHPLSLFTKIGNESLFRRLHEKVKRDVPDVTQDEVFSALHDLLPNVATQHDAAYEAYTMSKLIAGDSQLRTEFSSDLVGRFVRGVTVKIQGKDIKFAEISVDRNIKIQIESLKHLNYLLTIMSPRLKVVEYRGYDVIRTIFEALSSDEGHLLLPDDVQTMHERLTSTDSKMRLICDYVAGMTDRYALEFYGRLRETGTSIFKPI